MRSGEARTALELWGPQRWRLTDHLLGVSFGVTQLHLPSISVCLCSRFLFYKPFKQEYNVYKAHRSYVYNSMNFYPVNTLMWLARRWRHRALSVSQKSPSCPFPVITSQRHPVSWFHHSDLFCLVLNFT